MYANASLLNLTMLFRQSRFTCFRCTFHPDSNLSRNSKLFQYVSNNSIVVNRTAIIHRECYDAS